MRAWFRSWQYKIKLHPISYPLDSTVCCCHCAAYSEYLRDHLSLGVVWLVYESSGRTLKIVPSSIIQNPILLLPFCTCLKAPNECGLDPEKWRK